VTAKELLERNGDFRSSPLLDTSRKLHRFLTEQAVAYVIIGGLAVVRNGAVRTTHDVDLLLRREEWDRVSPLLNKQFDVEQDHGRDRENGVPVDVLFSGDDWGMLLPLPDPAEVAEFDRELGANFLGLGQLLQLKTAVYLAKKRDEGIELAAKDLADVVELLKANAERVIPSMLAGLHPVIRAELVRLQKKLGVAR
jgi:hypothetical protein